MARRQSPLSAVVDTNVAAYFLLGTEPHATACESFLGSLQDAIAPATWEVEIANVLWMAARSKLLDGPEALVRLKLARQLGIESVPPGDLFQGALLRSLRSGMAVYDCLFVELAVRRGRRLVTYDAALLCSFPDIAVRPEDFPGD